MVQGRILGLILMISLAGCHPSEEKKIDPAPKANVAQGESDNEKLPTDRIASDGKNIQQYMSADPMEPIRKNGAFIAEESSSLQEKFLKRFGGTQCRDQWIGFLQRKRFGVLINQMRPSLDTEQRILNSDGSESYFLPTTVIGYWIELRKFQNRSSSHFGRVEIREYAPIRKKPTKMLKRIYRWRAREACKKSLITKSYTVFRASAGITAFTDHDLRDKIKETRAGLLYLWSPSMGYSTSNIRANGSRWGINALVKVAKEKNLEITFLLDPQANVRAALRKIKELKDKNKNIKGFKALRSTSIELYMRMTGLHMPTILYYEKGRIARAHLPGISSEEQVNSYINDQSKYLSGSHIRGKYKKGAH